ncbi:MAG: bifunctional heptose 7-phosphate kinase/heptose 1-phosphate adenyltransferase, partial [Mucilaginibacter sp.]
MLTDKVRHIQQTQKPPAILVIGDLMIDHYIWGDATRLSPEAPVPIVNVKNESTTLGGAANVAQNLVALGAKVTLSGVIGSDTFGERLIEIMAGENLATDAIITDKSRPTTVKTRVVAGSHQLVRVD